MKVIEGNIARQHSNLQALLKLPSGNRTVLVGEAEEIDGVKS